MDPLDPGIIRLFLFLQEAPIHLIKAHGNVHVSSHLCCPQVRDFVHKSLWSLLTNRALKAAFCFDKQTTGLCQVSKVLIHT